MNHLKNQTSPYLLQHADNPVEWHPWTEQALQLARQENKPILLSIGYSACHWCHVMAHESFEDPATAEVMNNLFINIKVDREERPDLDKIYQLSYQLLAQRGGGWPLTMFLTPDTHTPFFAGTYFPNTSHFNLPAFVDVLRHVNHLFREEENQVSQHQASFTQAIHSINQSDSGSDIDFSVIGQAKSNLATNFDQVYGGFGGAPKFPQTTALEFLLYSQPDNSEIVTVSLDKMAEGGIYDHLGGGFYRYSVDERWEIPHFEKMLYDNAQLLSLYTLAWQKTGNPLYQQIAVSTAEWVIREMQSPEGGYFSSYDADSEGIEGKFYVWLADPIESLLTAPEYQIFSRRFGLTKPANFEGLWHLTGNESVDSLAAELDLSVETVQQTLDNAKAKLLSNRETRIPPGRDDKILVSWSALMIKAMSIAGRTFDRPDFTESALAATTFIHTSMWQNQRLLATYKDGKAHLQAYLDDYSFLIDALLELLQNEWNNSYFDWAIALADTMLEYFEDRTNGGFYFTAHDHEKLLYRPKTMTDDSLPSGNAIAIRSLLLLDLIQTKPDYHQAALATLKACMSMLSKQPDGHSAMLTSLLQLKQPASIVSLFGINRDQWCRQIQKQFNPQLYCFSLPTQTDPLPSALKHQPETNQTTAYLCNQNGCLAPVTSLTELEEMISSDQLQLSSLDNS